VGKRIPPNRIKWYMRIFVYIILIIVYETLLKDCAGLYSVGDEVTMADVALAPAIEAALRWGVDFTGLPTVWGIYERLKGLPAFENGDWRHQGDTPEELRNKE
jgi:maleylacetoacetate isomerase